MTTNALQERALISYSLEYIFSFTGRGSTMPEAIGPLAEGLRVNFYNSGGEISGPRIRGKLRAVGGDWVTVGKDGLPHDVKVGQSLAPDLDKAAVDSVKKWKFVPAKKDGKPVPVRINVEVAFRPD